MHHWQVYEPQPIHRGLGLGNKMEGKGRLIWYRNRIYVYGQFARTVNDYAIFSVMLVVLLIQVVGITEAVNWKLWLMDLINDAKY